MEPEPLPLWRRLLLCAGVSTLLFFGALVSTLVSVPSGGRLGTIALVLAFLILLGASTVFFFASVVAPDLLEPGHISWHHALILPPVYALICLAIVELATVGNSSLVAGPDYFVLVRFPVEPRMLLQTAIVQAILLGIFSIRLRSKTPKESE